MKFARYNMPSLYIKTIPFLGNPRIPIFMQRGGRFYLTLGRYPGM